jgi:hypothetical protein
MASRLKTRVKNLLNSLGAAVVKDLFGTRGIETIMWASIRDWH